MSDAPERERVRRAWQGAEPGRFLGRGHPAGDFLEAYEWKVLEEGPGFVRLDAHLPPHVRNPRGQLFGGFTPTYVDLVALFTVRGREPRIGWDYWMATTQMRVDYLAPVLGPRFEIESRLLHERSRTCLIETRFLDGEGKLLVLALTTIRLIPQSRLLGDA